MRLLRLWLLWMVLLALLLAALLGGPLGFWGGGGTGPSGEGDGTNLNGAKVPADRARAGDVDRLLGRCTAVEEALAGGDLGRAFELLQAGDQAGVPASVQKRWTEARRRADVALTQAVRQLLEEVRAGKILAARSRLAQLTYSANARVAKRLVMVGREESWPPSPIAVRGAKPAVEVGAAGKELARHRRVRVAHRGSVVDVSVWHATSQNVTVRMQDKGGLAFPVFDRAVVEPVDPSFREACEQVRICYRAGEGMAAWLWLCHCLGRPEAEQHEKELAALRSLVR